VAVLSLADSLQPTKPLNERAFQDQIDAVANQGEKNALEIAREALTSLVATALVAALNAELSALYPEPGATHFRLDPIEVAPGTGVFLVARWSGRPVGCGALRHLRESDLVRELGPGVGELKRMYVAPELRGKGIGRALLSRLESEARALGLTRLVLETGTRQTEALALYRRAGFTEIQAYGEYSASSGTSVCFAKVL
jgi:putative acetyltransferase